MQPVMLPRVSGVESCMIVVMRSGIMTAVPSA